MKLVHIILFNLLLLTTAPALAEDEYITLASTTSTDNSGLYQYLLPKFTKETGIGVRVIAVGTGQAIRNARNGDADVLLVHHKPSEEAFIQQGHGVERFDVMYNDYVIVGPGSDPAGIKSSTETSQAFMTIAMEKSAFTSRGDDSGTHKKEMELWKMSAVDPRGAKNSWYRETGSGMGATLNTASAINAYCLTDRGTWLQFMNKGKLELLFENDPPLHNQYGIILVHPEKHPHTKAKAGEKFIDWMLSDAGQNAIAEFKIMGEQAFFPNSTASSL